MLNEDDRYELPKEMLKMSEQQIDAEVKKTYREMIHLPKKKTKSFSREKITTNFKFYR